MKTNIKTPNLYSIILEDNDELTIQFVKDVLNEIFKQPESICDQGVIELKRSGYFEVNRLPLQFAEQKQTEVALVAKLAGIPFRCKINKL